MQKTASLHTTYEIVADTTEWMKNPQPAKTEV